MKFLKNQIHVPLDPSESKEVKEDIQAILDEALEPAEKLKKLRAHKGWSPKELGDKIGVDSHEIVKMEEGELPISKKTAKKLSEVFQIDFSLAPGL